MFIYNTPIHFVHYKCSKLHLVPKHLIMGHNFVTDRITDTVVPTKIEVFTFR